MKANRTRKNRAEWLIPAGLILLSVIPIVAGAGRKAGSPAIDISATAHKIHEQRSGQVKPNSYESHEHQ